ncbi:MAG: C69 family dipeptidase [Clostridia bacterium]|nr:C69 family dipeptidase [Clostridia bacterium]
MQIAHMQQKRSLSTPLKILIAILTFIAVTLIYTQAAHACTGLYVGGASSADGTARLARPNEQDPWNMPWRVKGYGGSEGEKLKVIKSENGFEYELPDKIYRFTCIPTCDVVDSYAYVTSAINEKGVSISATLTGYCCKEAIAANPYVKGGIVEDMFPMIVGACCDNARQGIELIAKIIDEKGSGEDNIIMISDQNECWYMEIYGGHQYCAVKAPDDCVCAMGNEFMIDYVDPNSEDVICSADLFNLPINAGFAELDKNGNMNLHDTYAGADNYSDYSHLRTWRGYSLLAPSQAGEYVPNKKYPLFYKPDEKVDLKTVMNFFRDRYAGLSVDESTSDDGLARPIGVESQVRTHILQTYKDVPADIACLEWLCLSTAEFSTYVPISNKEKVFDSTYTYNLDAYGTDDKNAYCRFKSLNSLTNQDRSKYGATVQAFWAIYENYYRTAAPNLIKEAAKDGGKAQGLFDDFCSAAQNQAAYEAKRIANDIITYINNTRETFKYKFTDIHKGDLSYVAQKYDKFALSFDIELFAKLYNWKIDSFTIRDHNKDGGAYDEAQIGNPEQADLGGKEIYIKMSKGDHAIEINSGNGHMNSAGKISIDGKEIEGYAYSESGKLYIGNNFYEQFVKLSDAKDVQNIRPAMTSENSSLSLVQAGLLEILVTQPLWIQILAIITFAILIIVITALIVALIMRRKKHKYKLAIGAELK